MYTYVCYKSGSPSSKRYATNGTSHPDTQTFWLGINSIVDSVSEETLPFLADQLVCQETPVIKVKK
jgi:hypothetical protein